MRIAHLVQGVRSEPLTSLSLAPGVASVQELSEHPTFCQLSGRHESRVSHVFWMNRPSLYSLCAPENPIQAPNLGFRNDHSPSLGHTSNPDADELITHSRTRPSLQNEPTARVTASGVKGFFRHVFLEKMITPKANLDLSDLKYNPSAPRQAEQLLEGKLNGCIDSLSLSKFIRPIFRQLLPTDAG
jgi:hypothetical protein